MHRAPAYPENLLNDIDIESNVMVDSQVMKRKHDDEPIEFSFLFKKAKYA
jgi:hypothetical protein